jgi:hypothetical protein
MSSANNVAPAPSAAPTSTTPAPSPSNPTLLSTIRPVVVLVLVCAVAGALLIGWGVLRLRKAGDHHA